MKRTANQARAITDLLPSGSDQRRLREFNRQLEMCGLACGIGLSSALLVLAVQAAIALFTHLFFEGQLSLTPLSPVDNHLGFLVVLIPPLGGLIVGVLTRYLSPMFRDTSASDATDAMLEARSPLPACSPALKPLAACISIGSGAPLGAEGPVVQAASEVGTLVGRILSTTVMERKILAAAGAAAGFAAMFSAPVAGVLLTAELLLVEFRLRSLLPVAVAGAIGAACRWLIVGGAPLYSLSTDHLLSAGDLPLFALLGACSGFLAVALSRAVWLVPEFYERLSLDWMWWPMLGGAVVGIGGLFCPAALGAGLDHVQTMVAGRATMQFLLGVLICKAIVWMIASGSGSPGGVLSPLLMIGGALGGVLASVMEGVLPVASEPGLWTVVCMAAVLAGVTRAPLTSIVLAVELTHQASAFLPLLIACVASDLVSLGLLKHSIMGGTRTRDGAIIGGGRELDLLAVRTIADTMTVAVEAVPASMPLGRLFEMFYAASSAKHHGYPVVDDTGRLIGMVTRSDLPDIDVREELGWLVVADVMSARSLIIAYREEPLHDAAVRMLQAGVGRLPVVSATMPDRLVGILSRSDVLNVLARTVDEQYRRERLQKKEAA